MTVKFYENTPAENWSDWGSAEKSAHKWIELYNNAYRFGVEDAWEAIEAGVTPAMPW